MTPAVPRRVVLITGASSGFGSAFARRFAKQGANLVLVARRRDRLETLSRDLGAAFGTSTTVIAADLSLPGAAHALVDDLGERGLTIDALVNSAGFGTAGPFAEEDLGRITDEIQVNVMALTQLSLLLLPQLLASPAGLLLNVSSTAAYQPLPNIAVYAATKAFVTALTEAIWQESRGSALQVLALAPGPTQTEFFAAAGSERFKVGQMLTVDQVVDAAFVALGRRSSPPSLVVGRRNRATALFARLAPARLALLVSARLTA
ncbi:SDR family NAD(P)-dependent oxidoreductase [Cryobacterium sp. AP23]